MIGKRGSPLLHFLDRYAGVPAVGLLSRLRRKRGMPSEFRAIGLLRTAAIGDTVLLSAVIADLRAAFPDAAVILFSGPTNCEIARMLEGVDEVVVVPTVNLVRAIQRVRLVPVDVLIDFGQWPRYDALLAMFSRAAFTIGFQTYGQYRHFGYDLAVRHSSRVHEIENFRSLIRVLGVETGCTPSLAAPSPGSPRADSYAVFHLWPGGRRKDLKQWPEERWQALIEELAARDFEIVLTGGAADWRGNSALIERVRRPARHFVRNAAGISLRETASVLAQARLVVSVDTGVMHLAAALGAPLVALHGPTSSRRWGPLSEGAVAIDSPLAGCGYLNLGWEVAPRPLPCMECIPYEAVRDACRSALAAQAEPAAALLVRRQIPGTL
jgi:ADP-heptose:LPS heptosyltransferase